MVIFVIVCVSVYLMRGRKRTKRSVFTVREGGTKQYIYLCVLCPLVESLIDTSCFVSVVDNEHLRIQLDKHGIRGGGGRCEVGWREG